MNVKFRQLIQTAVLMALAGSILLSCRKMLVSLGDELTGISFPETVVFEKHEAQREGYAVKILRIPDDVVMQMKKPGYRLDLYPQGGLLGTEYKVIHWSDCSKIRGEDKERLRCVLARELPAAPLEIKRIKSIDDGRNYATYLANKKGTFYCYYYKESVELRMITDVFLYLINLDEKVLVMVVLNT